MKRSNTADCKSALYEFGGSNPSPRTIIITTIAVLCYYYDMKYSLIVIGAGSGGLVAAELAARLGARVALVEAEQRLGGECLHTGCVPSKALICAARSVASLRQAGQYGFAINGSVDFQAVMRRVHGAISTIEQRSDNDEHFKRLGVDVYHGRARFIDNKTIRVGDQNLTAKKYIIATGSSPFVPDIDGLTPGDFLTNESVFSIKTLPEKLVVLGGGPIGAELGQAFSMLGSKVTILHRGERLLEREEASASAMLHDQLQADGVEVVCNMRVLSYDAENKQLMYEVAHKELKIDASNLLIAAGRVPNLDLNLEAANIVSDEKGILVDAYLRTTNHNVWAVGDCTGPPQFTHLAAEQAALAVRNALFPFQKKAVFPSVPRVTFTTPEIASVGSSEADLIKKGITFEIHDFNYSQIDRAVAENEKGFIKILTTKRQKIVGATIVGEGAGEMIAQIDLALWHNLSLDKLAIPIQAYPTYGLALKQIAADTVIEKVARSRLLRLLSK